MKIGIIGSGSVAQALGAGLIGHGHEVMLGTRTPVQLNAWQATNPKAKVGSTSETAAFGELIILAVKGNAALAAIHSAGVNHLAGKVIIDTCNPIADQPPVDGVLQFYTTPNESLLEQLQHAYPQIKFVKAFNSVGSAMMVNPQLPHGPPTMFICGNDAEAKATVTRLSQTLGWETADMGSAVAARAIEPLCMLWCIPGLARNEWSHAFKLLKAS